MKIRDPKSIIVIFLYAVLNLVVILISFSRISKESENISKATPLAPEYTFIEDLDYFHLKDGLPVMSLAATKMKAQGEENAEFTEPQGVYNYQEEDKTLMYQAEKALYKKDKELLVLRQDVKVTSDEALYFAQELKYYFKRDLIVATGGVKFIGNDLKTKDELTIESVSMRARPQEKKSHFQGNVEGVIKRKKKYEGKTTFASRDLKLDGLTSLAHLEGDVEMKRQGYHITSRKADIHLENFNKSLKYFVLNDDVKVTETVKTPQGVSTRRAFSERLEGFGKEQKMILSGAPRVEQGQDVVKGYRITIRENVDLIEVEDAMTDVEVKRKKN